METLSAQAIVDQIVDHILKQGGPSASWYTGITRDLEQRVFIEHEVPKKDHWRIHRKAPSANAARAAEKALIKWGCDGGSGGGDDRSKYVYAYLKSPATTP